MQVGLDIVTSANYKSQLQFQPTEYLPAAELTTNICNFIQQLRWADVFQIPQQRKAVSVSGHCCATHTTTFKT